MPRRKSPRRDRRNSRGRGPKGRIQLIQLKRGEKQGLRAAENVRANREWERRNYTNEVGLDFHRKILPGIQAIRLSRIMNATGLSLRYTSLIRRGLKVPHLRHWDGLARLARSRLVGRAGQPDPAVSEHS